jgi:predicted membrane channel-forming protein YqfA (hemolysin III family)
MSGKIVFNGGWIFQRKHGRPKLRFFIFLTVIWSFVSVVPFIFLANDVGDSALKLLFYGLILPQPIFLLVAAYFWWKEKPREWDERVPNPDYKLRNLY